MMVSRQMFIGANLHKLPHAEIEMRRLCDQCLGEIEKECIYLKKLWDGNEALQASTPGEALAARARARLQRKIVQDAHDHYKNTDGSFAFELTAKKLNDALSDCEKTYVEIVKLFD
jgi:hypothetical protein